MSATREYTSSVVEYFAGKAAEYDRVDEQHYWRLSDELLWTALERFVLPGVGEQPRILDAGGGTGRWSDRLLRHLSGATSTIVDLSPDMTAEARAKSVERGYSDRLTIEVADLARLSDVVGEQSFDLAISFHNVLGFVDDPDAIIASIAARLRPGGTIALFLPNISHAVYFNISIGAYAEAERILATRRGRFTSDMPEMHMFSAGAVEKQLTSVGLEVTVLSGTPAYIYPGYAESQIEGNTSSLADVLSDPERFEQIATIEKSQLGRRELAERGNNLLVVARKPVD